MIMNTNLRLLHPSSPAIGLFVRLDNEKILENLDQQSHQSDEMREVLGDLFETGGLVTRSHTPIHRRDADKASGVGGQ